MNEEEVKKILKEIYWEEFDYSQPDWKEVGEKWFDAKVQQICQLEPKPDEEFILDEEDQLARAQYAYETGHPDRELETEPDESMTDELIYKELCKVLAIRYGSADGEAMDWIFKNICQPLKAQTASIKELKPDEGRLLTLEQLDYILRTHSVGRVKVSRTELAIRDAQDAKTASIYQQKIEEIFREINKMINTYLFGDGSFINFEDSLQALTDRFKKEEK